MSFSGTGKYFFAGYDDYNCNVWSTLSRNQLQTLAGHENRVSCLDVSKDGKALCTGSWDTLLSVCSTVMIFVVKNACLFQLEKCKLIFFELRQNVNLILLPKMLL